MYKALAATFLSLALLSVTAAAAPPDRITRPVDTRATAPARTPVPRLAQPRYDQGAVDPGFRMDDLMLLVKPSTAQQSALNTLLADQQNPSSAQFHKWLTPEQFGGRFGLNASDHSKLVAWLQSEGLTVHESGRARNWIAFGGSAAQVEHALHTEIHRYLVNGETHFANALEPAVPAAIADVVGGFTGLHDFNPQPSPIKIKPDYNVGVNHFLVPEDWATIYDVAPLYAAGIDGTGVNIGIIGGSRLTISDIQAFRAQYNLAAKDPIPQLIGNDPGIVSNAMTEADLDIEWSGAVAPNATVYFYYSVTTNNAIIGAVNANIVQIISMSFGASEFDNTILMTQPIFQQANAQGITMIAATGDSGAATAPDSTTDATKGPVVSAPASYPESTAVGGTQFNEGTGTYWAPSNDANSGSALFYIPEIAWSGGGGGASAVFPKPDWQSGPGVPADGARDLPDVSLSASGHDGYYIVTGGKSMAVAGTSASAPSMAGIVALLNQYLVAKGSLPQPGLGNVNPQLYRLAQTTPAAFHDITEGSNAVPCEQGSLNCVDGTFGYSAGPGYDQTTGIGSIDANVFVTSWSSAANPVNVVLTATPSQATFNDTFQLAVTVTPVSGVGTPTGTVDFAVASIPLGSVALDAGSGTPTAILNLPGYLLGSVNTFPLSAQYRGDAAFSGGGATTIVGVTAPTGVSSIVPSAPASVSAQPVPSGLSWQFAITLREQGGVAATLTGFTIDGQDQPLAQYFARTTIPANGSLASQPIVFQNLATPLTRIFILSGTDATGQSWSRQISVTFLGERDVHQVLMTAVPLTVQQNPGAACPWPQQVILSEQGGFPETVSGLSMSGIPVDDQVNEVFGTRHLSAYRSLTGNLCWPSATPGSTSTVKVTFASGLSDTLTVSFAAPPANPAPVSVAPSAVTLSAAVVAPPVQSTLTVTAPDGQSWTAAVFPQSLSTGWLTLSQSSGTGSAQIVLQADPTGLENGVYPATIVIQGPNISPTSITVPVMFVYGDSSVMTITSLTNSASGQSVAAPGMIATMTGTALASRSVKSNAATFTYSVNGVPSGFGLTVNGIPAAFTSISPTQINFQIPYETATGPAVVGVDNNGSLNGFIFQVSPAAPGLYAPAASVPAGSPVALTMTGDGVTNPAIADGANAPGNALMYKTALPFTLTIAGTTVTPTSYGIAQGGVGVTTINCVVPASTPPGPQPVVVTVNGVSSPPVNLTVTAAP